MPERKKVLIAIHKMDMGGVQKSLVEALRAIDRNTCDITLYIRKDSCELLQQIDRNNMTVLVNRDPTRYYRKKRAVLYYLLTRIAGVFGGNATKWKQKLDRFVIENKMAYEKEHFFSDGTQYDIAVSYIQGYTAEFVEKYVPAKKKIVFFHGSTDENHALHEAIFPRFDQIVAVNAGCRDVLRGLYPAVAEKIGYLENYVDADAVRTAAKAYTVDRGGKPLVLCTCGRMTEVKGFDLAVEAAKQLKEQGLDFIWYFVADGPEKETIERQIGAYALKDDIRITGVLENPYPYYAACDIYVQPSREESYGLAIKEAQILCRPVVTTATVGGKSLITDGETGLIAEINAADLAQKILQLVTDPALYAAIRQNSEAADSAKEKETYRQAWSDLLN